MKSLVCEMCSSHDLVKQDGMYVCQACGTKYTVEEAKKLMIEGTVDVTGSVVQIDNTNKIETLLENARRSSAKEDWEAAAHYYDMVEEIDPKNIEAIFYSAYGKAKASLYGDDYYRREAMFNVLTKSVSVVNDSFDIENAEKLRPLLYKMSNDITEMYNSAFVYNYTVRTVGNSTYTYDPERAKTKSLFLTLDTEFAKTLADISERFPEEKQRDSLYILALAVKHYCALAERYEVLISRDVKIAYLKIAEGYYKKIKAIDPNYDIQNVSEEITETIEKQNQINSDNQNKRYAGCAIAVFGIIGWIVSLALASSLQAQASMIVALISSVPMGIGVALYLKHRK